MVDDENKKYFFKSLPESEINPTIRSILTQSESQILIWKQHERKSMSEEYIIDSFVKEDRRLYFKNPSIIKSLIKSKKIGGEIFFRIYLGRFFFFSTSKLDYNEAQKKYSVTLNSPIYKGQQRSNFRIITNDYVTSILTINKRDFKCIDVSSGGLCIDVDESDASYFEAGRDFYQSKLTLCEESYDLHKISVTTKWESKKNPGKTSVGIQFTGIAGQIEEDIFKHINIIAKDEDERAKIRSKK